MNEALWVMKVIIIGEGDNKTFCEKTVEGKFIRETIPTIGIEFYLKNVKFGEQTVAIQLWELAIEKRFRSIFPYYAANTQGLIVTIKEESEASYKKALTYVEEIEKYTKNIPIIFLQFITKPARKEKTLEIQMKTSIDEPRKKFTQKIEEILYMEANFETGEGVKEVFEYLVKNHYKKENQEK